MRICKILRLALLYIQIILELTTRSAEQTQALGRRLAQHVPVNMTIELISDLGGGKTTFVQGLAAGLCYEGRVTSPTFTLGNIYPLANGVELHHYDLYRLNAAGIMGQELEEDIAAENCITVIEWAGVAEATLPQDRLQITVTTTAETERAFSFNGLGATADQIIRVLAS